MKRLAILGSTGSIGTQTLDVVRRFPDRFEVVALAAGSNVPLLIQQAQEFRPRLVSVAAPALLPRLAAALEGSGAEISADSLAAATCDADLVVAAFVGSVGLRPVLAALECGRDVALANKEVLVSGGELVRARALAHGARLLPLDSEHVAIHQCLAGRGESLARAGRDVARVTLTASGGPFRATPEADLARVTPAQALAHPNWDMGAKISVDSATLMNKGFEVIEARWLFDLAPERIDVVVHPESVVHSLVEFCDGNWLAQLAVPDMRIPIAYVLGLPARLPLPDQKPLDLVALGALHFEAPDPKRFPALGLARAALRAGGLAPAALGAANEVAVGAFLAGELRFTEIAGAAEAVLEQVPAAREPDLAEVLEVDRWAREQARLFVQERAA